MTNEEFSDGFTTLLNSYNSQADFGEGSGREITLDEYEKSLYLTQAQDILVKSYFEKNLNPQGAGFDESPRRQVDFSSLVYVDYLPKKKDGDVTEFDTRGILFEIPTDDYGEIPILYILNEKLIYKESDTVTKEFVVVPINYKEYDRIMSKPYAQPLKKQAWRLISNANNGLELTIELIPAWNQVKNKDKFQYRIRYVRKPNPIILVDLPDDLTIEGRSKVSKCELTPNIHRDILNKAVELAIASRSGSIPQQQVQTPQVR